jgi:hypothetical protein
MKKQVYAMRINTIIAAADKITSDLEYLCSMVESPDAEFVISDAIAYSAAVTTLSNQLSFIMEDIASNDLTQDEDHVKLTEEEVWMLNSYTEAAEEAMIKLEEICGISLQKN